MVARRLVPSVLAVLWEQPDPFVCSLGMWRSVPQLLQSLFPMKSGMFPGRPFNYQPASHHPLPWSW